MKNILTTIFFISISCNIISENINYGKDECYSCRMLIVDPKFGGTIINKNQKTYKFDSVECTIDFLKDNRSILIKEIFVVDYQNPGLLIRANESSFLINKKRPSPMGGNISAYNNSYEVERVKKSIGGTIYKWDILLTTVNVKN